MTLISTGSSGKPANRLMYPCFVRVYAGPDPTRAKHAGWRFYMDWARSGSRFCETGEQGESYLVLVAQGESHSTLFLGSTPLSFSTVKKERK